jgi:hypothetical protein
MNKGYAFIVENDVFYTMFFPESISIANRWIAGLTSSPNFVECSLYPEICVGAVRRNNNLSTCWILFIPNSNRMLI